MPSIKADEAKATVPPDDTVAVSRNDSRRKRVAQVIASVAAVGFIAYGIREWKKWS